MKKALILITLVISFTLLLTAIALAKNGPHQGGVVPGSTSGGFAQDTDGCAGCHRAHTGTVANLLKEGANIYAFCVTCHNGTGANANVQSGLFEGDDDIVYEGHNSKGDGEAGMGLNGGGFLNAAKYTGRSSRNTAAGYGAVVAGQRHNLEGLDGAGPWTAWGGGTTGYGDSGSGPLTDPVTGGTKLTLKCTSCHDPHGTVNSADGSERYRILLNTVNSVAVGAIKSNEVAKDYTKDQYNTGTAAFCAACHTQYTAKTSTYDANDGKGFVTRHRHTIGATLGLGNTKTGNGKTIAENLNAHTKLPVEQSAYAADHTNDDIMVCLSCHQAHGTIATMTTSSNVSPANSSTLLRLNNRGVCQDCHQR